MATGSGYVGKKAEVSLWPLKLHYFLHGAGGSPILPFLPVIVKQMGMSGSAMGIILAVNQIICLLARPLIGSTMDRHPQRKIILFRVLIVVGAISLYLLGRAPPIETESKALISTCRDGKYRFDTQEFPDPCLLNKLHTVYRTKESRCTFVCQGQDTPRSNVSLLPDGSYSFEAAFLGRDSALNQDGFLTFVLKNSATLCVEGSLCYTRCQERDLGQVLNLKKSDAGSSDYKSRSYWIIWFCWLSAAVCLGCVTTYQDAFCHQILGDDGEAKYGQQRMWASIGWGCSALVVGYLVDLASQDTLLYDYSIAFTVMLAAWILDSIVAGKISIPQSRDHAVDSPLKKVGFSLINSKIVVFLLYCISVGFCYGALTLQFLLLEELGHRSDCNGAQAMKFLQGLCLTINCIGEIPVFFYSGKLIQRYGSKITMHVVLLVFAIRFLYYSCIVSPWQILFVELLNGLTTGLFYSSMTSFANQIAPEGSATTTTALAFTVTDGIGMASGAYIAGSVYQSYGASFTFACFGTFALVAFFLHIFAHKYISKTSKSLGARPKEKARL